MKRVQTFVAALAIAGFAPGAMAEPMSASEVAGFFSAGKFAAAAGSVFNFASDGGFSISHKGGAGESGTYKILSDGSVSRLKTGSSKPDVFFVDVSPKGARTLVYIAGKYKGKTFKLR